MVFVTTSAYGEVVARLREIRNEMDRPEGVELDGSYDVGSGNHTQKKKMPNIC